MPTLCTFYGIVIRMLFADDAPPHFHAHYAEFRATLTIRDLSLIDGGLPSRAAALVRVWASLHREELMKAWELCEADLLPDPIEPLE